MSRELDSRSKGNPQGADAGEPAAADPRMNPQMRALQNRIRIAAAFNKAHPEQVERFNQLTGGIASKGVRAIMSWQREHGLDADGKVGPATVDAAAAGQQAEPEEGKQEGPGEAAAADQSLAPSGGAKRGHGAAQRGGAKAATINFAEDEGSTVEGDSGVSAGGPVLENPNMMDNITGGATGEEKRPSNTTGEALEEAGGGIQDAGEGLHHMAGVKESPWFTAAMAPAIVQLLREGDYTGAIKAMAESFSPSEYIEGLTMAAEKLGLHGAVKALGKLAAIGAELDVSLELVMWTYEGLMAIAEAHEAGDRDSRITIYAAAFADAFLHGEDAPGNPGAVTEEQKEAAERGRRDGIKTAGRTGELAPAIGKELMRKYGSEKNARQAIIDELLAKAGFAGIKTHEGK